MDPHRKAWEKCVFLNLRYPEKASKGKTYNLLGMLRNIRPYLTQKGKHMAWAVLEDFNGTMELTVFPEPYAAYKDLLVDAAVVGVSGKIEKRKEAYSFIVEKITTPEKMEADAATEMHIRIADDKLTEEDFCRLRAILVENPGSYAVYLHMNAKTGGEIQEKIIKASSQFKSSYAAGVVGKIQEIPWVIEVWKQ